MSKDLFAFLVGTVDTSATKHRIAGTVTVNGVPARRRVYAFNRMNFDFLGATWSDATTGAWEISGMVEQTADRKILVISLDDTGSFNAEVADFITQVVSA